MLDSDWAFYKNSHTFILMLLFLHKDLKDGPCIQVDFKKILHCHCFVTYIQIITNN